MRHLCLVHLVDRERAAMSESEANGCTEESMAYDEALRGSIEVGPIKELKPAT